MGLSESAGETVKKSKRIVCPDSVQYWTDHDFPGNCQPFLASALHLRRQVASLCIQKDLNSWQSR
jgi:hypothetical protein